MTQQIKSKLPKKVIVHPLVLLSVVDHYSRVTKAQGARVCGILLGTNHGGVIDVTNSYAGTFAAPARVWCMPHLPSAIDCFKLGNCGENDVKKLINDLT